MYARWLLILLLALVGCGKKSQPGAAEKGEKTRSEQPGSAGGNVVKGKVLERMDASSYSYLRLSTASGEVWAAVPQTTVPVGADVTIANPAQMDGFESQTLKRKFDKIVFGTLGTPDKGDDKPKAEQPATAMSEEMRRQHAGVATSVANEPIKVEKASGADGRTIAEIFGQKAKLKDQTVAVRGKVVKWSANIMGKNWIHLRDGTGARDASTDDITVTTSDSAAVGDIVVVKGRVRTDKDLGMGYFFPVIIEDATVTK